MGGTRAGCHTHGVFCGFLSPDEAGGEQDGRGKTEV